MLNKLVNTFVTGKEKAVLGGLVAAGATFLLQHFGFHVSNATEQVIISLLVGVVTHLAVWAEKNTEVKKVTSDLTQLVDDAPEIIPPSGS